jgi:hypothetical protein
MSTVAATATRLPVQTHHQAIDGVDGQRQREEQEVPGLPVVDSEMHCKPCYRGSPGYGVSKPLESHHREANRIVPKNAGSMKTAGKKSGKKAQKTSVASVTAAAQ